VRLAWLIGGHLALALGVVGVFVPLLPTTPFLLLASFCYSRGSERFERWLLEHPRLGPPVVAWREKGVVSPRAKALACAALTASAAFVLTRPAIPLAGKIGMLAVVLAVAVFLLTRPSR